MSEGDILIAAATIMAALIKNEPERFKVPADSVRNLSGRDSPGSSADAVRRKF
jgi:hypothetical protein